MDNAGKHVIIDGYVSDPDRVFRADYLIETFKQLALVLGMQIIFGPVIKEVPIDESILATSRETGLFADEGGLSIFCMISTSHLSLHAWPLQHKFSADIFSCKDFNHNKALAFFATQLGIEREQVTVLNRQFTTPI